MLCGAKNRDCEYALMTSLKIALDQENSQTLEARKNHVSTCKLKYDLFIENFCKKLSHYISKFVIFAAILRCNVEPHVTPLTVLSLGVLRSNFIVSVK